MEFLKSLREALATHEDFLFHTSIYLFCMLGPAFFLWFASGRNLLDFLGIGQWIKSSDGQKEDTSKIDAELLKSCIQDLRMGNELSLAFRQLDHIPLCIATSRGADTITKLDLTECNICDLSNLCYFPALELLVLDKNGLSSISTCPVLPKLHTLWCNHNSISSLGSFLGDVARKFPNIYYLSLMRNPVNPDGGVLGGLGIIGRGGRGGLGDNSDSDEDEELEGEEGAKVKKAEEAYTKYRLAVLSRLPHVRVLDDEDVTPEEHKQAQEEGEYSIKKAQDASLNRDEDEHWKWPKGYTPPSHWLRDVEKMALIRDVQKDLDNCGEDFRSLAKKSAWEVNKRLVSRYLEASLWQPILNGLPVATAILNTIRFRATYPMPIRDKALLEKGLTGGPFIVSTTRSRQGWPILYLLFHNQKCMDAKINSVCLLYSMERAIQSLDPQNQEIVLFIDTKGFGYANVPSMAILSEMSEILAKHMPRRLGVVFVVNVSYVVNWVYDMVSIAMSEVTRQKFRFISSNKEEMKKIIGEYIDLNELPAEYGGLAPRADTNFSVHDYMASDSYLSNDPIIANKLYS